MSPQKITPTPHQLAHDLRHNLTDTEARLWSYLRAHRLHNVHFRRQHTIGKYIVDFCAPRYKLIIELDGSQHLKNKAQDNERYSYLATKGYRILRFWNNEVSNSLEGVIIAIEQELIEIESNKCPPPASPIFCENG